MYLIQHVFWISQDILASNLNGQYSFWFTHQYMSFLPAFCASTWDNFPFPFMFPVSAELLRICDYAFLFTDYSLCLQHPGLLCSWALIGISKEEGLSIFGHSYRFYFCLPTPLKMSLLFLFFFAHQSITTSLFCGKNFSQEVILACHPNYPAHAIIATTSWC